MLKKINYKKISEKEYEATEQKEKIWRINLDDLDKQILDRESDKGAIQSEIDRIKALKEKLKTIIK